MYDLSRLLTQPHHSAPIDLGAYSEGEYAGWQVVFNLDVEWRLYHRMQAMQGAWTEESAALLRGWLQLICVAWNFTARNRQNQLCLLPQPAQGGLLFCPQDVLSVVSHAFLDIVQPSKQLKDEVDAALLDNQPMPIELQEFLLATGERGIGFQAVYGPAPLTLPQFLTLSWIQQRVLSASSEEGRKELTSERANRKAIDLDRRERERRAKGGAQAEPVPEILDPARMTEAQLRAWQKRLEQEWSG